jgi:hypothetical protein
MFHHVMNKYGYLVGSLICLAFIIGALLMPPSCTLTPEQRAVIIPLSQTAAKLAESGGYLPPGSSVTIGQGVAIITRDGSKQDKVISLTALGLTEAVKSGQIQPGDALLVNELGTALIKLVPVDDPLPLPNGGSISDSAKESLPALLPPPGG